jgi:hypothetical protein
MLLNRHILGVSDLKTDGKNYMNTPHGMFHQFSAEEATSSICNHWWMRRLKWGNKKFSCKEDTVLFSLTSNILNLKVLQMVVV